MPGPRGSYKDAAREIALRDREQSVIRPAPADVQNGVELAYVLGMRNFVPENATFRIPQDHAHFAYRNYTVRQGATLEVHGDLVILSEEVLTQ